MPHEVPPTTPTTEAAAVPPTAAEVYASLRATNPIAAARYREAHEAQINAATLADKSRAHRASKAGAK